MDMEMMMSEYANEYDTVDPWGKSAIAELVGVTLASVEQQGDDRLVFIASDDRKWLMWHSQDCCESVYIDDVSGDWSDIIGSPILVAEERTNTEGETPAKEQYDESWTWTFYTLRTIKGTVDVRWYGSSNGYYSESVSFRPLKDTPND